MNKLKHTITEKEKTTVIKSKTLSARQEFSTVIARLESQLGKLDQQKALNDKNNLRDTVKSMEGSSGLMIITAYEMDQMLPDLKEAGIKAWQYHIGNPLIASTMARHNVLAALYVPPKILVYQRPDSPGSTFITYDLPSTLLKNLDHPDIEKTGEMLDKKFYSLVKSALSDEI